jgi:uroporphyrinogen-III synthase
VPAYKTVVPSDSGFANKAAAADVLTFTSASTVRGFAELLGGDAAAARVAGGKCIACIGPITARAATDAGLQVDLVASTYTTAGLLDALEAYFATRS